MSVEFQAYCGIRDKLVEKGIEWPDTNLVSTEANQYTHRSGNQAYFDILEISTIMKKDHSLGILKNIGTITLK